MLDPDESGGQDEQHRDDGGWRDLREAAFSATRRGWPVAPGTFLGANQRWYGREGARMLCPIEDSWAEAPVTDPVEAYGALE